MNLYKKLILILEFLKTAKIGLLFRKKTMKKIILPLFCILALCSCSDKKEGDWDDNIQLSTKTVEFNASGDSATITTKGSGWWITDFTVDSNTYDVLSEISSETGSYSIKKDCFTVERRNKNTLFVKAETNPLNVKRIMTIGLEAGDYFDRVTITQKAKSK